MKANNEMHFRGTTILAVRHNNKVAVAGDGQVTLHHTVMKQKAVKVRKIFNGKVIVGFAGATADALNLFERFEKKLEQFITEYMEYATAGWKKVMQVED